MSDASKLLTKHDYETAAASLNASVPAIMAVADVESAGAGFLDDGRVRLLFERHKFRKFTGGRFDQTHPQLSNEKPGGYAHDGPDEGRDSGAEEYARFSEAFRLDAVAAMKACSWGKFQIMGYNHLAAGFATVGEFVDAMKVSEGEQLKAFVSVVKAWGLADELRNRQWARFAAAYNGPAYRRNAYDTKMAAAYRKFGGR